MLIHVKQLFTPSYLFAQFAGGLSKTFFIIWVAVSLVMIAAAILLAFEASRRRSMAPAWHRWFKRLATMLSVMGIISLILLLFRYEHSFFFSMRAWMVLWVLGLLYWTGYLIYVAYRRVPNDVASWRDRKRIEKYLPKH